MNIKDFTIIIPCISFDDVKECIKKIRKIYKKIKIIVCLNEKNISVKKDKNLKFIFTKANGIGKKRNIAVEHCKTKYLAFLDSDAYPKKGWIESAFKLIRRKDVGIVAGPHIDPLIQSNEEKIDNSEDHDKKLVGSPDVANKNPILLIEDNESNIFILSSFLDELGCVYDIARNGYEGLDFVNNGTYYPVILLDLQMDGMNGFDFFEKLVFDILYFYFYFFDNTNLYEVQLQKHLTVLQS